MNTRLLFFRQIDRAGRVVIPRDLRRMLGLQSGDGISIQLCEEGLLLRPSKIEVQTKKG